MFRYMRNELNPGETRELLAWRNKSSRHESAFQEATDWENLRADFREYYKNSEATWEKIKEGYPEPWRKKEEVKKKIRRLHPLLHIAAALAFLVIVSEMYSSYQKTRILPGTYGASIIFPDGSSIAIENAPASDPSGYAGLADKVDLHTWSLLKGVVLSTMLGVGAELQFSGRGDLVEALRQSAEQNVARAGDQITSRTLDVQPTITIRPGASVRLLVHQDLVLKPWVER